MTTAVTTPRRDPPRPSRVRSLRAVVARGVRDNRRAPLSWGGVLGVLSAMIVALWPSIEDSVGELTAAYPEGLKAAFGIEELSSVEGYLHAEMLSLVVPVALAFFTMRCLTRATVTREEHGHLDTLLTLPLSRRVLVLGSYLVAGLLLLAILAVMWVLVWTTGVIAGAGIDAGRLAVGLLNVWPLAMAFCGLAAVAVGVLHRSAAVTGVTAGILGAMYVTDVLTRVVESLEPLRYASAFRWYGAAITDGLRAGDVAILTLVGVASAAAGAVLFDRRDVL